MKKQYEQPKAEKLEFDYEEEVVASVNAFSKGSCDVNEDGYSFNGKGKGNGNQCKKVI